jgi:hypothetical protein
MANTIAIKPKKRLWLSLTSYCKKTSMLHIKYISNKLQDKQYLFLEEQPFPYNATR